MATITAGRCISKILLPPVCQQVNLPGDPTFHHENFVITDATTGAELKDLDLDASVAESNYVIDKKAIWGCGIAVRRNQTKEE